MNRPDKPYSRVKVGELVAIDEAIADQFGPSSENMVVEDSARLKQDQNGLYVECWVYLPNVYLEG